MRRLTKIITKTLSVRISLMVFIAMAILLMVSLAVMLYYSRKAIKEEALQKASQTLEAAVQRIDNILLSVEQTSGNIYFSMINHVDDPDIMLTYSRKLVENNPFVAGCAIAFRENYYKDRQYFMAYVYRNDDGNMAYSDSPIIQAETFGNRPYTEQVWFTQPMETGRSGWMNPLVGMEDAHLDPIITFCLPVPDHSGNIIGVIGVDVSLEVLSRIILNVKSSANSYCAMIAEDGSFIIHPDSIKRQQKSVFTQVELGADVSVKEAGQAMISGESGYKPFRLNGIDYYVFYKPFRRIAVPGRSMERLNWSVGIIFPEDDIFGDYNKLLYYVLAITIIGLLLMFLLCLVFARRQLKPLRMLTEKAHRIAQGNYDEPIPDSHQKDEIGRLQDNFQQMQQKLSSHMGELEQLTATLRERGEGLSVAYQQAQKADRMKTAFLHNMTNQMIPPANAIVDDVNALCSANHQAEESSRLVENIQQNGHAITELLNNLIDLSDEEKLREGLQMMKKGDQP